jgi:hypothetical protein
MDPHAGRAAGRPSLHELVQLVDDLVDLPSQQRYLYLYAKNDEQQEHDYDNGQPLQHIRHLDPPF